MAFKLLGSLDDKSFKVLVGLWLAVNKAANAQANATRKPLTKGKKVKHG